MAERTIREAVANMSVLAPELGNANLDAPGPVGEQARRAASQVIQASKDREFHSLGLVLGYQYDASPVIVGDGTIPLSEVQAYMPTARPGARLPHLWLPDGTSLYDRLGNGLSLLRFHEDAEAAPLIDAAAARGVPLTVIELHSQAHEEYYGAPLLLVRPDQHVAWRGVSVERMRANAIIDQIRGV